MREQFPHDEEERPPWWWLILPAPVRYALLLRAFAKAVKNSEETVERIQRTGAFMEQAMRILAGKEEAPGE